MFNMIGKHSFVKGLFALILVCLAGSLRAETFLYVSYFSGSDLSTKDHNAALWTLTGPSQPSMNGDLLVLGSSKQTLGTYTFTSKSSHKNVLQVGLTVQATSQITLSAKVGNISFKCGGEESKTVKPTSSTKYVFEGNASGVITLTISSNNAVAANIVWVGITINDEGYDDLPLAGDNVALVSCYNNTYNAASHTLRNYELESTSVLSVSDDKVKIPLNKSDFFWKITKVDESHIYIQDPSTNKYLTRIEIGSSDVNRVGYTDNPTPFTVVDGVYYIKYTDSEKRYLGGMQGLIGFFERSMLNSKPPVKAMSFSESTDYYSRTVTPGDYGTLCLPRAVENPQGGTFFTLDGIEANGTTLHLTTTTSLEAGQPYLFIANGNQITCPYSGEAVAEPSTESSYLQGVFEDYTTRAGEFVLQKQDVMGFYLVTSEATPTVQANRCYMKPQSNDVKAYTFGTASAISQNAADARRATVYNLQGQRVAKPTHGIYVIDGKKVIR